MRVIEVSAIYDHQRLCQVICDKKCSRHVEQLGNQDKEPGSRGSPHELPRYQDKEPFSRGNHLARCQDVSLSFGTTCSFLLKVVLITHNLLSRQLSFNNSPGAEPSIADFPALIR